MIVPLVEESEWLKTLQNLPPFEPGEAPIVLVSPHPDDETLAVGGLVASQCESNRDVTVVAVTDGENAYGHQPGLGMIRSSELDQAVNLLGGGKARVIRLGLIDSGVSGQLDLLVERLAALVDGQTHLIAPFKGDYHPDHEACGRAAEIVAKVSGCRLTQYFFWTWHRGTPADLTGLTLESFALNCDTHQRKLEALRCHRSQLERTSGEPILSDRLLAPARRSFEVFARC